jgi:ADP-heptose:LPS heptosyltransferase
VTLANGLAATVRRACVFTRLKSVRWGLGDYMHRNIFLSLLRRACPQAEVVHVVARSAAERQIAAALGTPIVVLYGPGVVAENLWARICPRHHAVSQTHVCQPFGPQPDADVMPCKFTCECESAAGPYPRCMSDIEVDEVYRAIRRQLAHFPVDCAASG